MALGRMGKESEQEGVGRLTAKPQQYGNVPSQASSFGDDHDTAFPILFLLLPRDGWGLI